MKILPVALLLTFTSLAEAENEFKTLTEISKSRDKVSISATNSLPYDLICEKMITKIKICLIKSFCDTSHNIEIQKNNVYINKNSTRVFEPIDAFAEDQSARVHVVNDASTELHDCKPAEFRDYCNYAMKSSNDIFTLNILLRQQGVKKCEIDPRNVKDLDLKKYNIQSVKPLEFYSGLEKLNLQANDISDASPLSSLQNLVSVDLDMNTNLKDLSPLLDLPFLEYIEARETAVKVVPEIHLASHLKKIEIEGPAQICEIRVKQADGSEKIINCRK
jgi:Leucine-rich repeat (LRR) protein